MVKFCVFAGTAEGRALAEFLAGQADAAVTVCAATEYGGTLLRSPAEGRLTVLTGRLDAAEMAELLREGRFDIALDATHPYAAAATENILRACGETGTEYLRVARESAAESGEGTVFVPDVPAAVDYLNREEEGNILLTTGSRDLSMFTGLRFFRDRLYVRVLPAEESLRACRDAGVSPAHIFAMQGPFSEELNAAMLRFIDARFLVTKDGGAAGGFAEKAAAAKQAGARLVVLGRPPQVEGKSLAGTLDALCARFGFLPDAAPAPAVTVAGIGPGSRAAMTEEVRRAAASAGCLIGAPRMLEAVAGSGQNVCAETAPEKIAAYIKAHGEYRRYTVLMSGDTGFFSGAKKLLPLLRENGCETRVLPGLSSLAYFCGRLGVAYEDVTTVSLHGRERDAAAAVRAHPRVFFLTGGENGAGALCRALTDAGLGHVRLSVGERLSYPDERITSGTAAELAGREVFAPLSVVLAENEAAAAAELSPGLPDSAFRRGEKTVPMTKSEVRAVALSKLRLTDRAVCWDVGAGTGSVSVEMARLARRGRVFAVERAAAALALLRENAARFAVENLEIVPGAAPEACAALPAPTHAFIGGSGGALREIIGLLLKKNPAARIVASAVTLESVAALTACMGEFPFAETEVVSLTVARDRKAGPYRLMEGGNPVYLFTLQGGGARSI